MSHRRHRQPTIRDHFDRVSGIEREEGFVGPDGREYTHDPLTGGYLPLVIQDMPVDKIIQSYRDHSRNQGESNTTSLARLDLARAQHHDHLDRFYTGGGWLSRLFGPLLANKNKWSVDRRVFNPAAHSAAHASAETIARDQQSIDDYYNAILEGLRAQQEIANSVMAESAMLDVRYHDEARRLDLYYEHERRRLGDQHEQWVAQHIYQLIGRLSLLLTYQKTSDPVAVAQEIIQSAIDVGHGISPYMAGLSSSDQEGIGEVIMEQFTSAYKQTQPAVREAMQHILMDGLDGENQNSMEVQPWA